MGTVTPTAIAKAPFSAIATPTRIARPADVARTSPVQLAAAFRHPDGISQVDRLPCRQRNPSGRTVSPPTRSASSSPWQSITAMGQRPGVGYVQVTVRSAVVVAAAPAGPAANRHRRGGLRPAHDHFRVVQLHRPEAAGAQLHPAEGRRRHMVGLGVPAGRELTGSDSATTSMNGLTDHIAAGSMHGTPHISARTNFRRPYEGACHSRTSHGLFGSPPALLTPAPLCCRP